MRKVLLTEKAANEVMRIRENKLGMFGDEKCFIADAFGTLSTLINLGRDCEELQHCTDDILKVMEVVNKYNDLLNVLSSTDDCMIGKYDYVESEQDDATLHVG